MALPYLGPAGIFSTDDPVADQNQIDSERGPLGDWEDEVEEETVFIDVTAACSYTKWTGEERSTGLKSTADQMAEFSIAKLRRAHLRDCQCKDDDNFTYEVSER